MKDVAVLKVRYAKKAIIVRVPAENVLAEAARYYARGTVLKVTAFCGPARVGASFPGAAYWTCQKAGTRVRPTFGRQ